MSFLKAFLIAAIFADSALSWSWRWNSVIFQYDTMADSGSFHGTAPACNAGVCDGEDNNWFGDLGCGGGEECLTGHKIYCHRNPSPFLAFNGWHGTAPACGGDCGSCAGGYDCIVTDDCGSGASCFLGGDKTLCATPQPGYVEVEWIFGSVEDGGLDSGIMVLTLSGTGIYEERIILNTAKSHRLYTARIPLGVYSHVEVSVEGGDAVAFEELVVTVQGDLLCQVSLVAFGQTLWVGGEGNEQAVRGDLGCIDDYSGSLSHPSGDFESSGDMIQPATVDEPKGYSAEELQAALEDDGDDTPGFNVVIVGGSVTFVIGAVAFFIVVKRRRRYSRVATQT